MLFSFDHAMSLRTRGIREVRWDTLEEKRRTLAIFHGYESTPLVQIYIQVIL